MFMLSQLVHDHNFKVVMTGEGADELFGGYLTYVADRLSRSMRLSLAGGTISWPVSFWMFLSRCSSLRSSPGTNLGSLPNPLFPR